MDNNQFPFQLLYRELDALDEFWEEWWKRNGDSEVIVRPHTIHQDDPSLIKTINLPYADTASYSALFHDTISCGIQSGDITSSNRYPRSRFRDEVISLISKKGSVIEGEQPAVFFMGGGYGSGKSSTASVLLNWGVPALLKGLQSSFGVDKCKFYIPEYGRLMGVYDGRASEIAQDEARLLSEGVFEKLIGSNKSFVWDSSLSNPVTSFEKFKKCKENGYSVVLVGVLTDLEVARKRAMRRARQIFRFPPPLYFDASHIGFRENLDNYWEFADSGILVENSTHMKDPIRLREKNMQRFGF